LEKIVMNETKLSCGDCKHCQPNYGMNWGRCQAKVPAWVVEMHNSPSPKEIENGVFTDGSDEDLAPDCEAYEARPKYSLSVWYMHDNHTFTKLEGGLSDVLARAKLLGSKSTYGMLCPVSIICDGKEARKLKKCVHATTELGDTSEWEAEVRGDAEVMRLFEQREQRKAEK
jgi:hypothetical protein